MKLHEHQAKGVFDDAGIPVPDSALASTVEEAVDAAEEIGYPVAIKAQVQVGGRGKAGGIELVENADEAREAADPYLRLDGDGVADRLGRVDCLLDRRGERRVRDRYPGVVEDALRLVFV